MDFFRRWRQSRQTQTGSPGGVHVERNQNAEENVNAYSLGSLYNEAGKEMIAGRTIQRITSRYAQSPAYDMNDNLAQRMI